ncbi:MAG: LysR family transcriptional regulator ArgP [Pontibacterium sp.]
MDYKQLQALAAVIEEQNFERAALKLNVTQSAISQRVKQLEENLGHALLIRSQPITPTQAGRIVLKHFRQISLLQQNTLTELNPEHQEGFTRLAIGVNADSLASWFITAISKFIDTHSVLIDIRVDDQDETLRMLQNGEVVGCITSANKPLQGSHCIALGTCNYHCVASPTFQQRYFTQGVTKQALLNAPGVEFNHKDALHSRYLKRFFNISNGHYHCHRVPSAEAFTGIMIAGNAYGLVPFDLAKAHINSGELIDLTPDKTLQVPLYWHLWSLKSPLMRSLTHAIQDATKQILTPMD